MKWTNEFRPSYFPGHLRLVLPCSSAAVQLQTSCFLPPTSISARHRAAHHAFESLNCPAIIQTTQHGCDPQRPVPQLPPSPPRGCAQAGRCPENRHFGGGKHRVSGASPAQGPRKQRANQPYVSCLYKDPWHSSRPPRATPKSLCTPSQLVTRPGRPHSQRSTAFLMSRTATKVSGPCIHWRLPQVTTSYRPHRRPSHRRRLQPATQRPPLRMDPQGPG